MQSTLIQTFFEMAENCSRQTNTGLPGIGAYRPGSGDISGTAAAVGALGMMLDRPSKKVGVLLLVHGGTEPSDSVA